MLSQTPACRLRCSHHWWPHPSTAPRTPLSTVPIHSRSEQEPAFCYTIGVITGAASTEQMARLHACIFYRLERTAHALLTMLAHVHWNKPFLRPCLALRLQCSGGRARHRVRTFVHSGCSPRPRIHGRAAPADLTNRHCWIRLLSNKIKNHFISGSTAHRKRKADRQKQTGRQQHTRKHRGT